MRLLRVFKMLLQILLLLLLLDLEVTGKRNKRDKAPKAEYIIFNNRHLIVHVLPDIHDFSKFRNYHSSTQLGNNVPLILAYIIGVKVNATLISRKLLKSKKLKVESYPEILFAVESVQWFETWGAPLKYWRQHYIKTTFKSSSAERPNFVQVESHQNSFVYCAFLRRETISLWEFSLFTEPFDYWIWLLFLASFVFIFPLSSVTFSGTSVSQVVISIFSGMFSLGTCRLSRRSKLCTVWLLMCLILGHLYSGEMSSELISPRKKYVMRWIDELDRKRYKMTMTEKEDSSQKTFIGNGTRKGSILSRLYRKVRIVNKSDLNNQLLFEKRSFTMREWAEAHALSRTLRKMSRRQKKRGNRKRRRFCHVGQEVIDMGPRFFIALPPKNYRLAQVFGKLIEAGIYQRWTFEQDAMRHSRRVQERSRVISPTKVLQRKSEEFKELALEGKTVTIFLLWMTCVIISAGIFFLECILCIIKFIWNQHQATPVLIF